MSSVTIVCRVTHIVCKLIIFPESTISNTKGCAPAKLFDGSLSLGFCMFSSTSHILPWLSTCKITLALAASVLSLQKPIGMCPQSCQNHNRHNFLNYQVRVRRPAILLGSPNLISVTESFSLVTCHLHEVTGHAVRIWFFTSGKCWLKGVHSLYLLIECAIACAYQHSLVNLSTLACKKSCCG